MSCHSVHCSTVKNNPSNQLKGRANTWRLARLPRMYVPPRTYLGQRYQSIQIVKSPKELNTPRMPGALLWLWLWCRCT